MPYAEIAVDIPGDRVRTFTYSFPQDRAVRPGHVVRVPFGRTERRGLVFAISETTVLPETREVGRLLHEAPLLTEAQLKLARWIAAYYRTGLFLAASLMFPPGFSETPRLFVYRTGVNPGDANLTDRGTRALSWVDSQGRMRRDLLARRLGRGGAQVVDWLVRRGLLEARSEWERPRIRPVFRSTLKLAVEPPDARSAAERQRSPKRAALLAALLDAPDGLDRAVAVRSFGASAVRGVLAAGLAAVEPIRIERDPLSDLQFEAVERPAPTEHQAGAIRKIATALVGGNSNESEHRRFLLYGVTGSGKTEVYMRAAESCLAQGKRALILVPEISLTPQQIVRFGARFTGRIAVLHSGLSDGERFDQWWAVHRGEADIVLGSRSAIFAPVDRLGLVVLDEEHEWTYKQHDAAPRYHARTVAERLCALTGATLILGSATPDVETFHRAQRGRFQLLRLPKRVFAAGQAPSARNASTGQAPVEVVDMREELRAGHLGLFSRVLTRGIEETLDARGRVILFINRRGAASFVQCRHCGYTRRCRRCDTALTYHRSESAGQPPFLLCHYCSYRVRFRAGCVQCGRPAVRPVGAGTQRVVDEVEHLFPGAGVLRWDRDAARTARAHAEVLSRFLQGAERVLVGTQMVAKGLDIPEVTLVGVVSADVGLAIPDFRAGERAFQVLTQVVGRVGRGPLGGRAVIQTFQPDHYAVAAAARQDFESFFAEEIEWRRRYGNPPFTRLVRLAHADSDASQARGAALEFAHRLRQEQLRSGDSRVEIVGPTPSFPLRVRGHFRWHVILKGRDPAALLDRVHPPDGWVVDVDPISLS